MYRTRRESSFDHSCFCTNGSKWCVLFHHSSPQQVHIRLSCGLDCICSVALPRCEQIQVRHGEVFTSTEALLACSIVSCVPMQRNSVFLPAINAVRSSIVMVLVIAHGSSPLGSTLISMYVSVCQAVGESAPIICKALTDARRRRFEVLVG